MASKSKIATVAGRGNGAAGHQNKVNAECDVAVFRPREGLRSFDGKKAKER